MEKKEEKLPPLEKLLEVIERDIHTQEATIRSIEYGLKTLRKERNDVLRELNETQKVKIEYIHPPLPPPCRCHTNMTYDSVEGWKNND